MRFIVRLEPAESRVAAPLAAILQKSEPQQAFGDGLFVRMCAQSSADCVQERDGGYGCLGIVRLPSTIGGKSFTSSYTSVMKRSLLCWVDRKSTRLNSSHVAISYAVFCLKKKKKKIKRAITKKKNKTHIKNIVT